MSETAWHHDQNDTGTEKVGTFVDYFVHCSYQHTNLCLEEDIIKHKEIVF
jgi:hypothetical protein